MLGLIHVHATIYLLNYLSSTVKSTILSRRMTIDISCGALLMSINTYIGRVFLIGAFGGKNGNRENMRLRKTVSNSVPHQSINGQNGRILALPSINNIS